MTNFYKLVPDMAIEFPFELDKFQKEVRYSYASFSVSMYSPYTTSSKCINCFFYLDFDRQIHTTIHAYNCKYFVYVWQP